MGLSWENVYIFISSTFNDMHAERDYLVKRVFPQLSAWCEERKLRLVDIDLRWGVTEADASGNKRVVQVCLDRIDACRPFFLCFLGQRRGWVPDKADISDETYAAFPKLAQHYAGSVSVTELEILHALVDPLHNVDSAEHAFFFLRRPDYLSDIRNEKLLDIYTNCSEANPDEADAQIARWREEIIPASGRPVFDYSGDWDETLTTPEIGLPLYCPSTASFGSDAWRTAFGQWRDRWLAIGVTVGEDGEIADEAERAKAMAFNETFTRGRLTNFRTDNEHLAECVLEGLKGAITARFGERRAEVVTPLQRELEQQGQFLHAVGEGFIERSGDFDALNDYIAGGETRLFAITARAGMGKTSLIAHFIENRPKSPEETLLFRFIGRGDDSANSERLVRSLLDELKDAGKLQGEIPSRPEVMLARFAELLGEAGEKGKIIIILDALNQLEGGMSRLDWLPSALPANVKLIVSFKLDDADAEEFIARRKRSGTILLGELRAFSSMDDRRKLVTAYLSRYFKELDEPRIVALISSRGAENPLFLKAALSELRVFGVHADLSEAIRSKFGETPSQAFDSILARMENDPAHSALAPEKLVPHIFGWIAHSKYGLSPEELVDLLLREQVTDDRDEALDAVHITLRQLRPYLARREGRVDFFYESFKTAAMNRYTGGHPHARKAEAWHESLAGYFYELPPENRHKLMEQASQCSMARQDDWLLSTLLDFDFLAARLAAFNVQAVSSDMALCTHNDAPQLRDFFLLSSRELDEKPERFAQLLWGRMANAGVPCANILLNSSVEVIQEPWLRPLRTWLTPPGGLLRRILPLPQGAKLVNLCMGKIVCVMEDGEILWMDKDSGLVTNRYFLDSPDCFKWFSLCDNTLWCNRGDEERLAEAYDIVSGKRLPDVPAVGVEYMNGDHFRVNLDLEKTESRRDEVVSIWNKADRQWITMPRKLAFGLACVCVCGRRLIVGHLLDEIEIWDIDTNTSVKSIRLIKNQTPICLTTVGDKVYCGIADGCIMVINPMTCELERTILNNGSVQGHEALMFDNPKDNRQGVFSLRVLGNLLVSASWDGVMTIRRLNGQRLHILREHRSKYFNLADTDDSTILSYNSDSIFLWDLSRQSQNQENSPLKDRHTAAVNSLLPVTVDRVLSGSNDGSVRQWNSRGGLRSIFPSLKTPELSHYGPLDPNMLAYHFPYIFVFFREYSTFNEDGSLYNETIAVVDERNHKNYSSHVIGDRRPKWQISCSALAADAKRVFIASRLRLNVLEYHKKRSWGIWLGKNGISKLHRTHFGLIVANDDGFCQLLNPRSLRCIRDFSVDGRLYATAASLHLLMIAWGEGRMSLVDTRNGNSVCTVDAGVNCHHLAIGRGAAFGYSHDKIVRAWNLETGEQIATFDLCGEGSATGLAWTGNYLVVSLDDGRLIWLKPESFPPPPAFTRPEPKRGMLRRLEWLFGSWYDREII